MDVNGFKKIEKYRLLTVHWHVTNEIDQQIFEKESSSYPSALYPSIHLERIFTNIHVL
jgi:hypothetical protein